MIKSLHPCKLRIHILKSSSKPQIHPVFTQIIIQNPTKINSNFSQKIPSPCRQHPQLSTTLNPQNTNTHTNSKPTAQRLGPPPYRQTPTNSALAAIQRSADGSPPTIQPLYRHEQPGRQAKRPPPARSCSCPVSRPSLPPPTKKRAPRHTPGELSQSFKFNHPTRSRNF